MPGFQGVYANLPTPFTDDGDSLDLGRLHTLLEFLIKQGVDGVACSLSSGEYPYLTHDERQRLAAEVVACVAGRVPVIVGVSALTTAEAVALAIDAEKVGADGALIMPIQYWPLKRHEVIDHFKQISQSCSLPLGIYDNPGLHGAPFTLEMYATLAQEARVRFSKDSSGDLTKVLKVVSACGNSFSILHGNHVEMLPALLFGAAGVCTAIASVFPSVCRRLFHLSAERKWEEARLLFNDVEPVFRFFNEHSLARCVKEGSELMGRPLGPQRRPLSGLPEDERVTLEKLLHSQRHVIDGPAGPAARGHARGSLQQPCNLRDR